MPKPIITGRRFVTERVPHTTLQRVRLWWYGVWRAITTMPDAKWMKFIPVTPEDPRYADAPLFETQRHIMSFQVKNYKCPNPSSQS